RLGQGGAFAFDLFGDIARCQRVSFNVMEGGIEARYNNQVPVGGRCPTDNIPLVTFEEPISGFVWHSLRLEARDRLIIVHLDGVRLTVLNNPLPSSIGPGGMLHVPEDAAPPILFDDFVVNLINPRDDRDLVWLVGDAFCVQDFAGEGQLGVALDAAIEGDYVEAIWALGPRDVTRQSFMLYPAPASADRTRYTYFEMGMALEAGNYVMIPLHEGLEVTGRRLLTAHRGGYLLPDAPRNITASLTDRGIQLAWDPVATVEGGFNPGGAYLIRVQAANTPPEVRLFNPLYEDRGASSVPRYLIPWGSLYRPPTASGTALDALPDGEYSIEVWAVSARPSTGDECRAINSAETLQMRISGNQIGITMKEGQVAGSIGQATP
ncbi:MAG: hypothetical protein JXN59_07220, partial [Anaerolineae bacterium]|nr:hypothetical protein [Anaerolineae bacterium]